LALRRFISGTQVILMLWGEIYSAVTLNVNKYFESDMQIAKSVCLLFVSRHVIKSNHLLNSGSHEAELVTSKLCSYTKYKTSSCNKK